MMLFTHLLVGLLVAVFVGAFAPAAGGGSALLVAGLLGGLLPDLDMFADHRRTLHFPVGYGVLGIIIGAVGVGVGSSAAVIAATLLLAAWLHCIADVFGSGRSLRPWNTTRRRAVYNHALGTWHAPRRVVYDGSPGDFVLAAGLAALAVAVGEPPVHGLAVALVVPAAAYALTRRAIAARIPDEYESLSPFLKAAARGVAARIRRTVGGASDP